MERKGWTITTASVVAVIGALALNGTKLLEVINGLWLFLHNLTATAPMGLWSFSLALALGLLARPALQKYLPPCDEHPTRREGAIDLSGIVIGFVVMYVQLPTFYGVLLGILVGLLAPQMAKWIAVLWGLAR
jgi:hypothetical protein